MKRTRLRRHEAGGRLGAISGPFPAMDARNETVKDNAKGRLQKQVANGRLPSRQSAVAMSPVF
jgi:hypothetical protein